MINETTLVLMTVGFGFFMIGLLLGIIITYAKEEGTR